MADFNVKRGFAIMRDFKMKNGKLPKAMQQPARDFLKALRSKDKKAIQLATHKLVEKSVIG